jgi:methionyl-tRNA formyltransferase
MDKRMKVIYMGTPHFSISPLELLVESGIQVVGVYTQPDRPAGRGRAVHPSPVKIYAEAHGLRVIQPSSLGAIDTYREMVSLTADIIVVAAYGKILPKEIVNLPAFGCVNIHPSLLPRHRGPSPVAFAILEGDEVTGVTVMRLDEGMDSGPIIAQQEWPILPEDTMVTLTDKLFREGAKLLVNSLPSYYRGIPAPLPQEEALATYARKLTKEDGVIQWQRSADIIWRQVRAYSGDDTPGTVVLLSPNSQVAVGVVTGDGVLGLKRVQFEGKKDAEARDFLQGHENFRGSLLPS